MTHGLPFQVSSRSYHSSARTSLFASKNNNDNSGGGLVETVKNVAKTILPSSWFQSQQEKKAAIEKSRRMQEIKSNLKEMLQDAPLPMRIMGGLVGNVFSSALSSMAETMQEQQETVSELLRQAERAILADNAAVAALGAPIVVAKQPFSQSSSTTSINGKTVTNVQLGFAVNGSLQSGVAQLTSDGTGIRQLVVQVGGRVLSVNPTVGQASAATGRRRMDESDIIEAEIIEKETKLK
ncbi:hypothetical protein MPSEU_000169600 [Mayamaea pseudoterrestris]|nr:hypothetical protein MPSEU_000169600 [Mayamaea pseudoterrestris]